jgi:hypothetical protein
MGSRRLKQGVPLWDRREGPAFAGAESLPGHTPFFFISLSLLI